MIFTHEGEFAWPTIKWEKKTRKLSNNTLECMIYRIKIKRWKARQNKKEGKKKRIEKKVTED